MIQRVAVTGASGYIGQALLAELSVRAIEVFAVSRTPLQEKGANTQFIQVKEYQQILAIENTVLVHLAETALIANVEQRGDSYITETSDQTAALLAKNWQRVVYASSGQVYGTKTSKRHTPNDVVTADCVYTRAKLKSEKLVLKAGGVVARIGNIYGAPVKPNTVFADIFDQLPNTGPLKIRDENPARDYLWINDLAKGLADISLGHAKGIFNLGSGATISAGDIARTSLALHGSQGREVISSTSTNSAATNVIALDISATTEAFGWRPTTSLSEGLTKLIQSNK
jgi:UDP-glucose 4-epimerase